MFTGIIETTGKVISLEKEKSNLKIRMESSIAKDLKIGQSIAHDGVCLTVERFISPHPSPLQRRGRKGVKNYMVTAVKETLDKTNLGLLKTGSIVNLERSLKIGDRLDGHFVQGHVDTTAICTEIKKQGGSFLFEFRIHPPSTRGYREESRIKNLIIEKGSICINGVSLTVVDISELPTPNSKLCFSVAIIPHTFNNTNFSSLKKGNIVNIEFDMLGKYIGKIISSRN